MKVKGILLKIDNYESNSDRKLIIRLSKEACPEDILKYQQEEVEIDLEGGINIPVNDDLTPNTDKLLETIKKEGIKYAKELIEDAHSKLTEMEDKPASGHALQNNIAFQDKE